MILGLLVLGVLGAGGYVGYQQMATGAASPVAAVPADVPVAADMAAGVLPEGQPADPFAPPGTDVAGFDPLGAPIDPAAASLDGADQGTPDPRGANILTPPTAPAAPDAVVADGGLPPAEPMDGFDPMADAQNVPADGAPAPAADPMAAFMPAADPAVAPAPITDPAAPAPADVAVEATMTPPVTAEAPAPEIAPPVAESAPTAAPAAPVVAAPAPAPAPAPMAPVEAEKVEAMRTQIVTLEKRLADLESELKTLRARPAPAAAAPAGVSEADFNALKRRIDELAAAPKAPAPAPKPVQPVATPVVAAPIVPPAASQQVVPATVRALTRVEQATGARPANTNVAPAAVRTAPTRATAPAMGVNWQLRSAQPGRAWIAQPGTQEMRSVAVGDEVPGLGRILSIAQGADGRWAVRGALGSVSQ